MPKIVIDPSYLYNFFWDREDPAKPFKAAVICNKYSLVPDYATRIQPPDTKDGMTPCWNGEAWTVRVDWRQVDMWDKETGKKINYPHVDFSVGDYERYTQLPPNSDFDIWKGNGWVYSEEKEVSYNCEQLNTKRNELMSVAVEQINMLNDIVLYDDGSGNADKYQSLLLEWRKYRGQLAIMKFTTGKEVLPTQPKKWDELE